jgi:hypothetical protein
VFFEVLEKSYMRMGELEKAITVLKSAIDGKKDFRQAYDLLEECYTTLVCVYFFPSSFCFMCLFKGDLEQAAEMKKLGAPHPAPCGNNESIFQYYLR